MKLKKKDHMGEQRKDKQKEQWDKESNGWTKMKEGSGKEQRKEQRKEYRRRNCRRKKKAMSGQKNTIHGSSTGRKKGKIH